MRFVPSHPDSPTCCSPLPYPTAPQLLKTLQQDTKPPDDTLLDIHMFNSPVEVETLIRAVRYQHGLMARAEFSADEQNVLDFAVTRIAVAQVRLMLLPPGWGGNHWLRLPVRPEPRTRGLLLGCSEAAGIRLPLHHHRRRRPPSSLTRVLCSHLQYPEEPYFLLTLASYLGLVKNDIQAAQGMCEKGRKSATSALQRFSFFIVIKRHQQKQASEHNAESGMDLASYVSAGRGVGLLLLGRPPPCLALLCPLSCLVLRIRSLPSPAVCNLETVARACLISLALLCPPRSSSRTASRSSSDRTRRCSRPIATSGSACCTRRSTCSA